ncbi:MAG: response regulator transcription factor [Planctomycetota bacterium]
MFDSPEVHPPDDQHSHSSDALGDSPSSSLQPTQDSPSPAQENSPRRVYAVDDDPNVLHVLRTMLSQARFDVVCYSSAVSFLKDLALLSRGMVITDQVMPEVTGLQLHQQLRTLRPMDFRLILITAFPRTSLTVEAMKLGAITVLDKPFDRSELLEAVEDGFQRLNTISESDQPLPPPLPGGQGYLDLLSDREREIIQMVYQGSTNKSISIRLELSIKTIEKHRARGMRKMKVHSLAALVRLIDRETDRKSSPHGL